jgi:hypothetical protein
MSSVTEQDPKELANYRFAKGAVIILGVLIVIALIALVLGFALRSPHRPAPPPPPDAQAATHISLPPGAQVISMDVDHGRLILRMRNGAAEEIDIIDTGNGRLVSQIKVPANTAAPAD